MMQKITLAIGAVLSLLGVGAFVKTRHKHITVLIPFFVGVPMFLLGLAASREDRAADAMHAATGVSALGLVAGLQGILFPQLFQATAENREAHQMRTAVQVATTGLCAVHQALAIKSFLDARR
jgi:hypothetical protein